MVAVDDGTVGCYTLNMLAGNNEEGTFSRLWAAVIVGVDEES